MRVGESTPVAELLRIPDFHLLKGIRPGGVRMMKLPTLTWEAEKSSMFKEEKKSHFNILDAAKVLFNPSQTLNDLSYGDYRYWCGYNNSKSREYAACRFCGDVCVTYEIRKTHQKSGCAGKLTQAINYLGRDKLCVICNIRTTKKIWGLPICSKECEFAWSYEIRQPDALRAALNLLEATS